MKKVLISFIGNNDCLLSQGKEGAIISILREREFDTLYILYNDTRYLQFASEILLFCQKKFPHLTVRYQEADSINPIDYNLVYPSMVAAVKAIQNEEGTRDVEYTISLTSGARPCIPAGSCIVMSSMIKEKFVQSSKDTGIQVLYSSLSNEMVMSMLKIESINNECIPSHMEI